MDSDIRRECFLFVIVMCKTVPVLLFPAELCFESLIPVESKQLICYSDGM